MNILLTHGYFLEEDEKEQQIMRPYPPLGILYIAAYLESSGFSNNVFDSTFSSKAKLKETLLLQKPKVIGLYTNLMTKINVLEVIHFIQNHLPASEIILGGPDVRYNAENYLRHGAGYLVMGEGEQTMLELVDAVLNKKENANNIRGVAYLSEGKVIYTEEREKIKDLNVLPIPARDKIDLSLYLSAWKKHHGKNAISVSTMRGCPYTCKWCSRAVYGLSYRRRSPEKVVEELIHLKKQYNPDSLWFVDDVFTISHKWMEAFDAELKKHQIKIPYECITRADRMNEEVVKLLRSSGCFRVWIGAESGSQKVIDLMDRRVDVKQVREMIQLTRRYQIEAGTFIMLGYPGETEEDIQETIQHLKRSDPDHFTITVAYPIKGTELFEEIEATTDTPWTTSTDRQIDFKRTFPRQYYQYAVRHVINEVNGNKAYNKKQRLSFVKFKLKSIIARMGMFTSRYS
jgi:anaerobic magnesium-protoporphyrin IX monomethyl ester cyclase